MAHEKLTDIYPQTERPRPLAVGDVVQIPSGERWLLCIMEPGKVGFVSIKTGFRWGEPVKCVDSLCVSYAEISELTGGYFQNLVRIPRDEVFKD
jgi:hypothetical protein